MFLRKLKFCEIVKIVLLKYVLNCRFSFFYEASKRLLLIGENKPKQIGFNIKYHQIFISCFFKPLFCDEITWKSKV